MGFMFALRAELEIGNKLLKLADNPELLENPTRDFIGDQDPRSMYKCLFASRQSQQTEVFAGTFF